MKISNNFNKFFFGVILKELKKCPQPMKYQNPFTQEWYLINLNIVSDKGTYQLLKLINPHYPKLNDLLPASTTVLSNKHLVQHIQWIERWCSQNGYTMKHIEDEWEQIIQNSK